MDTGQLVLAISVFVIFTYFIGSFALGAIVISAREMAIWLRLKRFGKIGDATLERLCFKKRNRSSDLFVIFQSPEADDILVAQLILGRTFKRLQQRTFVTVTYLPDTPFVARLWGKDEDTWSRGFPTVLTIVFIAVAWPLFILWLLVFTLVYAAPQTLNHPLFRRIDWKCAE